MDRENLKKLSALLMFGAITYWASHPEDFAEGPKASLKYAGIYENNTFKSQAFRESSLSIKGRVPKFDEVSSKKFKAKTRKLFKLEKINQIIEQKLEVEALLRSNPTLAAEVPGFLTKRGGNRRPKLAIINSLAEVETKQSRAALLEIAASEKFDESYRVQAIVSSSELLKPGDNIVEALWKLTEQSAQGATGQENIDGAALMSLGSIASNPSLEQSAAIVDKLSVKLKDAEESGDTKAYEYIDALGNSGDPRVLEIADRYILSPLPKERAMGASILRKVPDAKANEKLLELISLDESVEVRREAVQVISYRKLTSLESNQLASLMMEEPDSGVRLQMIGYFKARLNTHSSAKAHLEKLLPFEDNEDNYQVIVSAIGSV